MAPPPRVSPSRRPRPSVGVTVQKWPLQLSCTPLGMMVWTSAVRAGWRMEACATPLSPLESAVVGLNPGSEPSIAIATRRASPRVKLAKMSTASEVSVTFMLLSVHRRWRQRALLNLLVTHNNLGGHHHRCCLLLVQEILLAQTEKPCCVCALPQVIKPRTLKSLCIF